jgi:hypothetical protein
MPRVSAAVLLVLAALVAAGCADNLLKERPSARAARTAALKPTFSAAGSAQGESSVCSAYHRQLRVVQLRQQTSTGKAHGAELKAKELSLNAIIADACE